MLCIGYTICYCSFEFRRHIRYYYYYRGIEEIGQFNFRQLDL